MPTMNDNIQSLHKALCTGDYNQSIKHLRLLGRRIIQAWHTTPGAEKTKLPANPAFIIKYLSQQVIASYSETNLKPIKPQNETELRLKLSRLYIFLMSWEDADLTREADPNTVAGQNQNLRERQFLKLKASIDKPDRHAIHAALLAETLMLAQQTSAAIDTIIATLQKQKIKDLPELKNTLNTISEFENNITTQDLIDFILKHIDQLNSHIKRRDVFDPEKLNINIRKEQENAAKAIFSFTTPTKKKKALKVFGIFIAVIIALACGISTGGAIYALLPALSTVAIFAGVFIFTVGFIANFRFFAQNIPNFLITLTKKGNLTELINREGKREQFSPLKKYILFPIAGLASLAVGSASAALTYVVVLKFAMMVSLAAIWPPLPVIIVGILALVIGVGLIVSTLTAIIDLLKKPLPTRQELASWIKNLTPTQILGFAIMALLVAVALFGLVYYWIAAGADLAILIGKISIISMQFANAISIVVSVVAFTAQIAFTVLAVNKLYNVISNFFSKKPATDNNEIPARKEQPSKSWLGKIKSIIAWVYPPLSLVSNAGGNALLVYDNTSPVLSVAGAVACGFNSLTGNIPEQDPNQLRRALATEATVKTLEKLEAKAEPKKVKSSASSEIEADFIENLHRHRESWGKKINTQNLQETLLVSTTETIVKTSEELEAKKINLSVSVRGAKANNGLTFFSVADVAAKDRNQNLKDSCVASIKNGT